MKQRLLIVSLACLIPAAWYLGIGIGAIDKPDPVQAPKVIREAAEEIGRVGNVSTGEIGTAVYTVEMWQDGAVLIKTGQRYINQLSEHTMLVTDRSLDDVRQEILDVMDMPVEEAKDE